MSSRAPVGSDGRARRSILPALAAALTLAGAGCASTQGAPTRSDVDAAIRARTASAGIRLNSEAPLPPDVNLGRRPDTGRSSRDGGFWKSPSFQATLADLGVEQSRSRRSGAAAKSRVLVALPVGSQAAGIHAAVSVDLLVQRPARIDAARLNARAVGERLVWDALSLVAQVRTAHADALAADRRLTLAEENASLTRRLAEIADARLRAGDISDLEARAPKSDAARTAVVHRALGHDCDLARLTLAAVLGLDENAAPVQPQLSASYDTPPCVVDDARLKEALASRPDVRAAEIAIEAATARAHWERDRVLALVGILDANSKGDKGFEYGSGRARRYPVVQSKPGRRPARADAEVERARRLYPGGAHSGRDCRSPIRRGPGRTGRSGDGRGVAATSCRRSRPSSARRRAPTTPARLRC